MKSIYQIYLATVFSSAHYFDISRHICRLFIERLACSDDESLSQSTVPTSLNWIAD